MYCSVWTIGTSCLILKCVTNVGWQYQTWKAFKYYLISENNEPTERFGSLSFIHFQTGFSMNHSMCDGLISFFEIVFGVRTRHADRGFTSTYFGVFRALKKTIIKLHL